MADFDVQSARDAGYSEKDIIEYLAGEQDFDIDKAMESGYRNDDILHYLVTGKEFRELTPAETFGTFLGQAPAAVIGMPVDIATGALNIMAAIPQVLAGKKPSRIEPFIERPVGGAEYLGYGRVSLEDIRPENRPFAVAGEVVGASVPFALVPFGLPARGFLKPLAEGAQKGGYARINIPKVGSIDIPKYLMLETGTIAGAATGGAAAELFDPGDISTRFMSEVAGGFFSPVVAISRTAARGAGPTSTGLLRFIKSFSEAGRKDQAADIIQAIVIETGEDPQEIARLLRLSEKIPGMAPTSAQKVESKALSQLEKILMAGSNKFASDVDRAADKSLTALRTAYEGLAASGDPAAMRVAAQLRGRYFENIISRRMEIATQEALEARAATAPGATREAANIQAREVLEKGLENLKTEEKRLWGKIDKELPVETENLANSVIEVQEELLLSQETFPALVQDQLKELLDGDASLGQMNLFRTALMEMGRKAVAEGEPRFAKRYYMMADGIYDDIGELPEDVVGEARAFSKAMNDAFKKTYAGDVMGETKRAGERVPPEMTLESAYGAGGAKGSVRLRQFEEAAELAGTGKVMLSAQEQFLRSIAPNIMDETGKVNPTRLRDFMLRNLELFKRFPHLAAQLRNAETAQVALEGVEQAGKVASKAISQRAAFSNMLGTDDPITAVTEVLSRKNTARNFKQLSTLAKKSGDGAVAGLKSSVMNGVFNKATSASGAVSFEKVRQLMTRGMSADGRSIYNMLRQNKIMTASEARRWEQIILRGIKIERAMKTGKGAAKLADDPDGLFDVAVRIIGAKVGGAGAAGTAGSSLIGAAAGSRLARKLAEKVPMTRTIEILEEAAKDPKLMAKLVTRGKGLTLKQKESLQRQINAFLFGAGIMYEEE